jgi:hypothetical protein
VKTEIRNIVALISLIAGSLFIILPSVIATNNIITSVDVEESCDLVVDPTDIDFDQLNAGHTSSAIPVNMLDNAPESNIPSFVWMSGSSWSDGTHNFPVGSTEYIFPGGSATSLTGSAVYIGMVPQDDDGKDVDFQVSVPANQAAGLYSQTITVTFSCQPPD